MENQFKQYEAWSAFDQATVQLYATDEHNRYFCVNGVEPEEVEIGVNAFTRNEWELVFVNYEDI